MAIEPRRLVLGLAGFQVVDAALCAIPARFIAADLDHIGFPKDRRPALPIIKGTSAVGLLVGLKKPRLGELTAAALIAYFVAAVGFHIRAGDGPVRSGPAAALLTWSALAVRSYRQM